MPISVDSDDHNSGFHERSSGSMTIGLINNMPDSALEATERQFTSLLNSASEGTHIRLLRYMVPEVPRQDAARRYLNTFYTSVDDLWDRPLDGLIVSGREPLAADLKDEPYWNTFTNVVDWARENTHSTVFSCLAAHAAILYLDGVTRRRRNDKLCGILSCERAADHPLTAGIPSHLQLPHSRWNGVLEDDLTGSGYRVLTRCDGGEIDTFIKQERALLVFFQGHPEYEPDTLLREYRRDVARYFSDETIHFPSMPQNYLDIEAMKRLGDLEERARGDRSTELSGEVTRILSKTVVADTWRLSAVNVYKNWLRYLSTQKEKSTKSKSLPLMTHAPDWADAAEEPVGPVRVSSSEGIPTQ
jgi:homoserine O-succinyltransferase/O-acetyltransferase